MEKLSVYFLKTLKKLKLWKYFNFTCSKNLNNVKVKIPIVGEIGLTNMVLTKNWLDLLIEKFTIHSNDETLCTFVDVGANVGQTLLRLKTIFPEVNYLGFEPNSTCVSYTQKLIRANNFKNCVIQNVALSTKIDILALEKTLETDSRASLISDLRPGFLLEKESVFALDYSSFYLDEKISFVKIDVEGGEYEVLKGMEKAIVKHQPIITCEILDSHNDETFKFTQERATKVCEMIKLWNYNIIRLHTTHSTISNFERIDSIDIVQYTSKSSALNDYLFYPAVVEDFVVENLKTIINSAN